MQRRAHPPGGVFPASASFLVSLCGSPCSLTSVWEYHTLSFEMCARCEFRITWGMCQGCPSTQECQCLSRSALGNDPAVSAVKFACRRCLGVCRVSGSPAVCISSRIPFFAQSGHGGGA